MTLENNSNKPHVIGYALFFLAYAIVCLSENVNQTLLGVKIKWLPLSLNYLVIFALVLIAFKIFLLDKNNLAQDITILLIGLIFAITGIQAGWFEAGYIAIAFLFIIASKNINLKTIFEFAFFISSIIFLATLILSFRGSLPNLVYFRANGGFPRQSLGDLYTTVLSSSSFFMLTSLVGYQLNSGKRLVRWIEIIFIVLFSFFMFIITGTRVDFICSLLLIAIVILENHQQLFGNKTLRIITGIIPTFAFLWIIFSSYAYNPKSGIWKHLDSAFSGRLNLDHLATKLYPPKFFGQHFLQIGNGGSQQIQTHYFFIDSSFARIFFMNGIVTFILAYLLLQYCFYKIAKDGSNELILLLWLLIVTLIEGLISSTFFYVGLNPALLVLGKAFNGNSHKDFKLKLGK